MIGMINWEQRTITGISGKIYKIEPEKISTKRFREYEILSLMLAFSSDFKTFYTTLTDIIKQIESLTNIGQIFAILSKLKNLVAGIGNYTQNSEPKIIRFCALFCNEENEDVTKFDNDMIKSKYDDWGNVPISDFFLLVSDVTPSFKKSYQLVKKEQDQN